STTAPAELRHVRLPGRFENEPASHRATLLLETRVTGSENDTETGSPNPRGAATLTDGATVSFVPCAVAALLVFVVTGSVAVTLALSTPSASDVTSSATEYAPVPASAVVVLVTGAVLLAASSTETLMAPPLMPTPLITTLVAVLRF